MWFDRASRAAQRGLSCDCILFIWLSIKLLCKPLIILGRNGKTMTTSNSPDKSQKAQLAPCNTSDQTLINQWHPTMAKQDLITLDVDNCTGLEQNEQLRMWQLFWGRYKDKFSILDGKKRFQAPNQLAGFRQRPAQLASVNRFPHM